MEHLDLDEEQSVELIKSTVRLAHLARNKFVAEAKEMPKELPWIVASIGPYGAHLHDGSEYTGEYADVVDAETIRKWHRVRIEAVVEAGVDGFAIETIPCRLEAEALVELMAEEYPDVKYWLSFQCKDEERIAHGENFAETCREIWAKAKNSTNILAIGTNCVNPKVFLYQSFLINSFFHSSFCFADCKSFVQGCECWVFRRPEDSSGSLS